MASASSSKAIVSRAFERGLVVPAFNVPYLPMVKSIVEALRETETCGFIEASRIDVEKGEAKSFSAVATEFRKWVEEKYIKLHMDHIPVMDEDGNRVDWMNLITTGIDNGYHSVMIDGSRLPLQENIAVTKRVVEMAHARGVVVESELGVVLGHGRQPIPPYEELFRSGLGFTRVDEARVFVRETGLDWLAVAVGNIHGATSAAAKDHAKVEARINIEHLKKLREAVGVPLVLHGGSGIKLGSVLEAIRNGISKINVATELRQTYDRALRQRRDIEYARSEVKKNVVRLLSEYKIIGSARQLL